MPSQTTDHLPLARCAGLLVTRSATRRGRVMFAVAPAKARLPEPWPEPIVRASARAGTRRAVIAARTATRGGRMPSSLPDMSETATVSEAVLTERRDGILLITLNRPDQRNAFNKAQAEGVAAALDELDDTQELQVGVLTGA